MSTSQATESPVSRRGYSVDEVAVMYGLSRQKVYDAITLKRLHSFKVGKRRIIPQSALDDWERGQ